jgi:hypothetical protein
MADPVRMTGTQEYSVSIKPASPGFLPYIAAFSVALLAGCDTTGRAIAGIAVAPMCTIHAVTFNASSQVDVALVSERTSENVNHGFTRFRGIGGPRGNAALGFTSDVYGISEAWSRNSAGSVVYRAQAHPARRPIAGDFNASAWSINTQDARGTWSSVIAGGTANQGNELDTPAAGGLTVPQLMPVGLANPQVFGCAGARSQDDVVRTTWLIEVTAANATAGTPSRVGTIQDLLTGDDRFVRNPSVPLGGIGPNVPPTPTITNRPGDPVREGSVTCAMAQFEDDIATRELHMLAIRNGVLHHSMASNFGPATRSTGATFNRFRNVSAWGDVGQALGGRFGTIVAATMVGQPRAVHVFFVAESGGLHKLWHAVRFSANGGSWRPADDVLALNTAFPRGRNAAFRIAAGKCPVAGQPQESELVYAMWTDDPDIRIGRIVSTPRQWAANIFGTHSQLFDLSALIGANADPAQRSTVNSLVINTRPFRDDARP